jgi:hypothetical protein
METVMAIQILVGADPEVFVKQGGLFKSAHGLIKGDKKNPQPVRNGAVQVDGMALEFNINPASTESEFIFSVQDVFAQMRAMVPDFEVVAVPVAEFTEEYMKQQPEEAKELGCDPDFNAWANGRANDKPDGDRPFRTASGHVHIGWTDGQSIEDADHLGRCHMVVKQLDFYLGLPSLMYDQDTKRRSMYGKAGAYRPKSYGVEYRTLSNRWLSSEKLMGWVFRTTQKAVKEVMSGNMLVEKYGDIQEIINRSDVKEAERIINEAGLEIAHA